jgi:hypothetical protein
MPSKYELSPRERLIASRHILASKIEQEKHALSTGGMAAASPIEYRHVEGRTREQRLVIWEEMLADLDRKIAEAA